MSDKCNTYNWKKYLALTLAGLMLAGCLGACGKKQEEKTAEQESEALAVAEAADTESTNIEETASGEDDAEEETETRIMYALTNVNVRSGAGTDYSVAVTLTPGDEVGVIGSPDAEGWVQIENYRANGYCKIEFLSEEPPATSDSTSSDAVSTDGTVGTGVSVDEYGEPIYSVNSDGSHGGSGSSGYTAVSDSYDYGLLPDNLYDAVDLTYLQKHGVSFSMNSSGAVTWKHEASSCSACQAGDEFIMSEIYK